MPMNIKRGSKSTHKKPSSTQDSPSLARAFGVKPDWWIREQANAGMIEPFEDRLVRDGVISYGLTSFGYDLRAASEWKIFTNVYNTVVDPKQFDPRSFVEYEGTEVIIPPNSFVLARSIEYIRMPEDTLAIAVGKSTYARCFSGNTRVALADGRAPTLEEMARQPEELYFGYSIGPFGKVIITLLEAPRYIGRDSVLEIELDQGQKIQATPDHLFLTRDGRMTQAADLRPGISLMPLYRSLRRGYEMVYQPSNGFMWPTHRLADEWNVRFGIYPDIPATHRHHKDHDRLNNNPWNIERISASEHIRMHNSKTYGEDFDPIEHGQSVKEAYAGLVQDDVWYASYRQQQQKALRLWHHPDLAPNREALLAIHKTGWTEYQRDLQGQRQADFWAANPEHRAIVGLSDKVNHKVVAVRELPGEHDVYCLSVPEAGNFALEAGVFVHNCGIVANVTPIEPGWEGHVTLEFSNTTPLPAKMYAGEGCVQLVFFQGERPEVTYKDRKGKYQGQKGITLPRI